MTEAMVLMGKRTTMYPKKSKCKPPTKAELKWIADFEKLANRMPSKLWLYAASGQACIMKTPENGEQMGAGSRGEGVNDENLICTVSSFKCDGGDW